MTAENVPTFVLFATGYDPSLVRLGDLVLHNYTNPLQVRHYTCTLEPRADDVVSTPVRNVCVTKTRKPGIGFSLEALDLVEATLKLAAQHQIVLTAEAGQRIELKRPDTYLKQNVLTDQGAVDAITLWLSAARSEYMTKMRWLRRPKVWMLTGLYVLENSKVITNQAQFPAVEIGARSAIVGGLTSVPLGGSVELSREKTLEASMEFPGRAVWAAQYQLLDTKYVVNSEDSREFFRSIDLLPDITAVSRGSLRGTDDGDDGSEVAVQVLPVDEEPAEHTYEDVTEAYYDGLNAAIAVFEDVMNSPDSDED